MRRVLAVLVALCVAVPALALAADTDPRERFTATDQAKARSLVLRRSDFTTAWKRVPATPDSDASCPGFAPNESDLTLTGKAEGNFQHAQGVPSIYSASEVWASKANAVASWTRSAKPAIARCLAHFLREGVEKDGGKLTVISQGRFSFPKLAPRTAAYRVVARVVAQEAGKAPVTIPLTVHLIALGHGRGDVAILTTAFGAGVPTADLRFLAKRTASRLAAAKL